MSASLKAKHAAIRRQLGCAKNCAAIGPITHRPGCPAAGKWITDETTFPKAGTYDAKTMRLRDAVVPVAALEELITTWRDTRSAAALISGSSAGYGVDVGRRSCADDVQALIDKVTP